MLALVTAIQGVANFSGVPVAYKRVVDRLAEKAYDFKMTPADISEAVNYFRNQFWVTAKSSPEQQYATTFMMLLDSLGEAHYLKQEDIKRRAKAQAVRDA